MTYDVVVTETIREVSKEIKFKNYEDYLDWDSKKDVVTPLDNVEESQVVIPMEVDTGTRLYLTEDNTLDIVSVGDIVYFESLSGHSEAIGIEIGRGYEIIDVEDTDFYISLLIHLNESYWPCVVDNRIYKLAQ